MALLTSRNQSPPDGHKYLQKETGVWITGDFHDELVDRVIEHRKYKGLAPVDRHLVDLEVQRQICLGMPKGVCRGEKGEDYEPFEDRSRILDLTKIAQASATLIAWLGKGLGFVAPEESARRAEICRGCPFNKKAAACVCTPFFKTIDALVPQHRREPDLLICALCGCSLMAKVLAPIEVVRESVGAVRLPDNCWIKG